MPILLSREETQIQTVGICTWLHSQPLFDYDWRTGIGTSRVALCYDLLKIYPPFFDLFFLALCTENIILYCHCAKWTIGKNNALFCLFSTIKNANVSIGPYLRGFKWYRFFFFDFFRLFIIYLFIYFFYLLLDMTFDVAQVSGTNVRACWSVLTEKWR